MPWILLATASHGCEDETGTHIGNPVEATAGFTLTVDSSEGTDLAGLPFQR
jgi:hypothetical protein